MFDVVTIGSATRDGFFRMNYELIDWPKTPTQKAIVFPLGEKLGVAEVFFTIGGNAANAAVTFTRQGFKTACVAKTGKDVSGEEIRRRLNKEGVDAASFSISKTLPTAYSVLFLLPSGEPRMTTSDAYGDQAQGMRRAKSTSSLKSILPSAAKSSEVALRGERTILSYHGASNTLSLEDVPLDKLLAKWWYISLAGESATMFPELVSFAAKNNIRIAFNPSGHHLKERRESITKHLDSIAFLVMNEEEAAILTGIHFEKEEEVFKKLDAMTPGIVAITRGPKGVSVSDGKQRWDAGIFPEKKVVDRTGAGDAFGSGFVAGLLHRQRSEIRDQRFSPKDIEYAIRLASANATSVVERIGATEGTLTKEEFEEDSRWQELEIKREPISKL